MTVYDRVKVAILRGCDNNGHYITKDKIIAQTVGVSSNYVSTVRRRMGIGAPPRRYEYKPNYSRHFCDVIITFDYLAWLEREKSTYRSVTGREPDGPALKRWIDTHGCRVMEARGVA